MIEPGNYWISVIVYFTVLITTFNNLFKALEELMKTLPQLLKTAAKFLVYSLTLALPNIGVIWYFFYLAGFSPYRFSESKFFWAMVAQPTIAVSIYAFIWGKWLYPRLQHILSESPSQKLTGKEAVDIQEGDSENKVKPEKKSHRQPLKRGKASRTGGKKI